MRLSQARGLAASIGLALLGVSVAADAQLRRDDLLAPGYSSTLSGGTSTAAGAQPATAEADLAQRLERLERMLNEQSLSDFVLQLQQLQQEVQDLRGQVELHQYQLQRSGAPLPQLGQSYAEQQRAAAETAASDQAAGTGTEQAAAEGAEGGAAPVPVAPPPKTGVGALGAGSDSGGTLALPSPETLEGSERDAYRTAFELLKDRDYEAAKKEFAAMLVRYPQGQFADNGVYWLGEIGYVNKDYAAALTHFNRLISDYPGSPKVPSAMLKLGYVYAEQQDLDQARNMLEAVSQRFPDTTEGRLAKGRLEQMTRDGG